MPPRRNPYGHFTVAQMPSVVSGAAKRTYNDASRVSLGLSVTEFGIRNLLGEYHTMQREMHQVNRAGAFAIQNAVIKDTYSRLDRPNTQTGRLERALSDPRHVGQLPGFSGFQHGFTVFNPEILDRSQAKYWRAIEFGSAAVFGAKWRGRMVDKDGIPLFGSWGGTVKGFYTNRWGTVARAGAPFTRYGANSSGKLRPLPQKVREAMINSDPTQRRLRKPPKAPYRSKHIEPKHAMERAFERYTQTWFYQLAEIAYRNRGQAYRAR